MILGAIYLLVRSEIARRGAGIRHHFGGEAADDVLAFAWFAPLQTKETYIANFTPPRKEQKTNGSFSQMLSMRPVNFF